MATVNLVNFVGFTEGCEPRDEQAGCPGERHAFARYMLSLKARA